MPRLCRQCAVNVLGLKAFLGGVLGAEVCSHLLSLCVGSSPREEVAAGHAQLSTDLLPPGLEALKPWKGARRLQEAYNPPIIVNALCYFPPVMKSEHHKPFFRLLCEFQDTAF